MQLYNICITFSFGIMGAYTSNEFPKALTEYMTWTQTGDPGLSGKIFDTKVDLIYQDSEDELEPTSFYDYRSKVENAAASVSRSMAVEHFKLFGKDAIAYFVDRLDEGDFLFVHILKLRRKKDEWKIHTIEILHRPCAIFEEIPESIKNN